MAKKIDRAGKKLEVLAFLKKSGPSLPKAIVAEIEVPIEDAKSIVAELIDEGKIRANAENKKLLELVPVKKKAKPEPAPAKSKSKAGAKGKAKKAPTEPHKAFTMPFKPIDTLTDEELTKRIEDGVEAAESAHEDGFVEVAEMLMRSVARARKQLNKRS
jgi:hypothetical protein